MWTNGSRASSATPANALRTGKPSPSKPLGALVTARTGRCTPDGSARGIRGSAVMSSTVTAGTTTSSTGSLLLRRPPHRPTAGVDALFQTPVAVGLVARLAAVPFRPVVLFVGRITDRILCQRPLERVGIVGGRDDRQPALIAIEGHEPRARPQPTLVWHPRHGRRCIVHARAREDGGRRALPHGLQFLGQRLVAVTTQIGCLDVLGDELEDRLGVPRVECLDEGFAERLEIGLVEVW